MVTVPWRRPPRDPFRDTILTGPSRPASRPPLPGPQPPAAVALAARVEVRPDGGTSYVCRACDVYGYAEPGAVVVCWCCDSPGVARR